MGGIAHCVLCFAGGRGNGLCVLPPFGSDVSRPVFCQCGETNPRKFEGCRSGAVPDVFAFAVLMVWAFHGLVCRVDVADFWINRNMKICMADRVTKGENMFMKIAANGCEGARWA